MRVRVPPGALYHRLKTSPTESPGGRIKSYTNPMSAANKPEKSESGSKRGRKPETLDIEPEEADALLSHFLGMPGGEDGGPEEGETKPDAQD